MLNENPVCVVVGAGTKYSSNEAYFGTGSDGEFASDVRWGLGGALPIQFSLAGYSVVILSRTKQNLIPLCDHIVGELGGSCEIVECDVTDPSSANLAFEKIHATYKSIDVLCYNAGFAKAPDQGSKRVDNPIGGGMLEDIDMDAFASSYAVHAEGLLRIAKLTLPRMRELGGGSFLVSGNTMSLRGAKGFGLNAPSKFAQRALTQVMAQEYKDFGVHIAHVIIDGAIDAPGLRKILSDSGNSMMLEQEAKKPGSMFLNPRDIADTFVAIAKQPPSVWTHEISLTPSGVSLGQRL